MTKFIFTLTLSFIFIFTAFHGFAQRAGGGMPAGAGAGAGGGKMPALVGRIYGKIVDATTNQSIPYASVIAMRPLGKRDTIVGGMLSLDNGDFNLDNLPMGGVKIKISVLGYKDLIKSAALFPPDMEVDLGDLKIQVDAKVLGEVTISAEKSGMVMSLDKKTFNVDKNITSTGGTAEDVLKNVPSLSVDADGGVKLRNNNTTIYVDGRPTVLSLNQISSDQIESVEVISNPSAKYEASTSGGIVNIVLKKNNKPGYNGFIGLGIGTVDPTNAINRDIINLPASGLFSNNRYDATANLNIKQGRFNITTFFSLRSSVAPTEGYTINKSFLPSPAPNYYQYSRGTFDNNFKIGRAAIDYSVNNRNTLTVAGTIVSGVFNFDVGQYNYFLSPSPYLDTVVSGPRKIVPRNNFTQHQVQGLWKKTYPKKGKEWTFDLNYGWGGSNNAQDWYYTLYNQDKTFVKGYPDTTKLSGGSDGHQLIFQSDFTNPINDSTKLEAGVRMSMSSRVQSSFEDDYKNGAPIRLAAFSSDYQINDNIYAGYVTYGSRFKNGIGYQAGVRYEQSDLLGTSRTDAKNFGYNYPGTNSSWFKSFFPSLYLSKKLNKDNEVQLNFSRKINRPNFMQIIPAVFGSDALNIQRGNPGLKPEFINLVELNYNRLFGANNWIVSAYYRNISDPILSYTTHNPNLPTGFVSSYLNGSTTNVVGLENTLKYNIVNNLDLTANVNVFNLDLQSPDVNVDSLGQTTITSFTSKTSFAYTAKGSLAYKFLKGFSTQLSANYESKIISAQGYRGGFGWMDFAVKKSFFGGAASITFQVNDIFNSRKFNAFLEQPTYYQEQLRRRDVRNYKLSVQFPFGKLDSSIFRKAKDAKKQQGQQDQPDFNGQ